MFRLPVVLMFVIMAFMSWGMYAPFLHEGQVAMASSRWRPFICVGLAYFLVAVLIPTVLTARGKEPGQWTLSGTIWSLVAGTLGCLGSLGILFAFDFGGKPIYVMPIVFGCAPVVNTLVTAFVNRAGRPNVPFFLGVALVALGAAGVLVFKPETKPAVAQTPTSSAPSSPAATTTEGGAGQPAISSKVAADASGSSSPLGIILSIAGTALCWGSYGPTLHQGQARMGGSRLRPFICVGVMYFFLAIVVPLFVLASWSDKGSWTVFGGMWSFLAGALGALGALGIILAFNAGGRPIFVMPLVFGGAPVVNTLTSSVWSYLRTGQWATIGNLFLLSLGLAIAGAAMVLVFAPRPKHHAPATTPT